MSISTIAQTTNRGISNARDDIDNMANTLLQPRDAEGIGGFLFDISESENISLSSEITDHYTENNSYLNDHIVRKPIIITLTGFIGELVYEGPQGAELLAQELDNRLETVEAYAGEYTPGVIQNAQKVVSQAQSTISAINQQLDKVQNIVSIFSKTGQEETRQQTAYNTLRTLWEKAEPFSVATPWAYFDSMVIQAISVTQNEDTQQITDISVTLKQIRQAETGYSNYDKDQFAPREEIQSGEDQSQGKIQGEDEELTSFLAGGSGGLSRLFGG